MTVAITRLDLSAMALRERAARATDSKISKRLLAIALVLEGRSRRDAAEVCAMDRQTLRDWVHRYNGLGPEGLGDAPRRNGPPRRLSASQQAQIAAWVRSNFHSDEKNKAILQRDRGRFEFKAPLEFRWRVQLIWMMASPGIRVAGSTRRHGRRDRCWRVGRFEAGLYDRPVRRRRR